MQLKLSISIIVALVITKFAHSQTTGGSVGTSTAHPFSIISNGQSRVTITPDGNVGIGITNPSSAYKLSVYGDVKAKKLKITIDPLQWPDYVFAPAYKLPSLQEVEEFIKKHKHLPGVPSAKDVETEGLDVGDTQAILLKKIEELTLYLIEQNKKIEVLEKQMQQTRCNK